jgi:uncharacterized delta-60 repeat protein
MHRRHFGGSISFSSLVSRRLGRAVVVAISAAALAAPFTAGGASFGIDGVAIPPIYIPGGDSIASAVVRQSDGKLIVAGTAAGPLGYTMFAARFTAAGALDTSYGAGGVAYVPIPSFATRLETWAAALDGQGNLVLAGDLVDESSFSSTAVARLAPSGSPDTTFGPDGVREIVFTDPNQGSRASGVAVDSAGRIVVLAHALDPNTLQGLIAVARLGPDGSLDTSFNGTGQRVFNFGLAGTQGSSLVIDGASNIIITGLDDAFFSSTPVVVVKLTAAGQFDLSFNGSGVVRLALGTYSDRLPAAIDTNGRIVVASESNVNGQQAFQLARLTSAGAMDSSFGVGGVAAIGLTDPVPAAVLTSMALDSRGRIVLSAPGFNVPGNANALFAMRLLDSGSVDPTFNAQSMAVGPSTWFVAVPLVIDSGDSIVLVGAQASPSSGSNDIIVGRLTSAGAADSTFNGTGIVVQNCGVKQLTVTALARQRDGKLVLSGYTGVSASPITDPVTDNKSIVARLTTSGALDPTFNGKGFKALLDAPSIEHFRASTVVIDANDNIVFGSADQAGNFVAARITPSGAPDATFNGSGYSTVSGHLPNWSRASSLAIDTGGNIVLAGRAAAAVGGASRFEAIRFAPNGVLDPTFANGGIAQIQIGNPYGVNDLVGLAFDSVGRIVLGATAEDAWSQPNSVVMRLTRAGALDTTFAGTGIKFIPPPPNSFSVEAGALAVDASDRVVLAGDDRGWLVVTRLTLAGDLDPTFNGSGMVSARSFGQWFVNALAIDSAGRILLAGDTYGVNRIDDMRALRFLPTGIADPTFNGGEPLHIGAIPGPHLHRANAIALDAAGGIYLGGSVDRAMAVVKLFDGVPNSLAFVSINHAVAYYGFDVVIQGKDENGNAQPVSNATTITISLAAGSGTLAGPLSCVIPAGDTTCRLAGLTYSKAEGNVALTATATAGDLLAPVTSPPFTVDMAFSTTFLTTNINPSLAGQIITLTATVSGGNPTGSIDFSDGYGLCGIAPLTGTGNVKTAVCITGGLPVGTTRIVAYYAGDANNTGSGGPLLQTVTPAGTANVALASTGAVATASSTFSSLYPVSAINNGDRAGRNFGSGGVWKDATQAVFPDWVEIDFNGTQTIDRVIVYSVQDNYLGPVEPNDTLTFTKRGLTAFDVQAWSGFAWVTLGSVTGNNLVKRTVSFAATTTSRIRVMINAALGSLKGGVYSYVAEIETWTPGGSPPPPPSGTTLASSANPAGIGQSVTFTATVSGSNPVGTVNFTNGGTTIAGCDGVALTGAGTSKTAACTTSFARAGTYSIVAGYSGGGGNPASMSAPVAEVIKRKR